MLGLTRANLRHVATMFWQGRNPVARVYDSIGADFWLAPAPGWLNLGLWEGQGDAEEAPAAVARLVSTLAATLPQRGIIVDVGNGLGAQDPLIADETRPRTLIAVNITESQLRAGRATLARAGVQPVVADAVRLPFKDNSVDGLISVEAAFHFSSRARFFAEVSRVLRPGGVLAMSDVAVQRLPRRPDELAAGLLTARAWGLRWQAAMTVEDIAGAALSSGLTEVRTQRCGDRVIAPALNFLTDRLRTVEEAPRLQRLAVGAVLASWRLLWRRGIIDYILLTARASQDPASRADRRRDAHSRHPAA